MCRACLSLDAKHGFTNFLGWINSPSSSGELTAPLRTPMMVGAAVLLGEVGVVAVLLSVLIGGGGGGKSTESSSW